MKTQPAPETIWKLFADEQNGKYVEWKFYHSDKSVFTTAGFQMIFDAYYAYKTVEGFTQKGTYTRIIVPYKSEDGFRFEVAPADWLAKLMKPFSNNRVSTGNMIFDKTFVVKTNEKNKMTIFLHNEQLLRRLLEFPKFNLQISSTRGVWEEELPKDQYELTWFTDGLPERTSQLNQLRQNMEFILGQFNKITIIEPVQYF